MWLWHALKFYTCLLKSAITKWHRYASFFKVLLAIWPSNSLYQPFFYTRRTQFYEISIVITWIRTLQRVLGYYGKFAMIKEYYKVTVCNKQPFGELCQELKLIKFDSDIIKIMLQYWYQTKGAFHVSRYVS